jgi:hypothetical protein
MRYKRIGICSIIANNYDAGTHYQIDRKLVPGANTGG